MLPPSLADVLTLTLRSLIGLVVGVALNLPLAPAATAQKSGQTPQQLQDVGVTQKLGDTIPTQLPFKNEAGEPVQLQKYLDGSTPVMLTLNYHRCPMLCSIQLHKFASTVAQMEWSAGEEYRILTVDINPRETPQDARNAKDKYLQALDRPEKMANGWHFLTGPASSIDALTDAVGFRYRWLEDEQQYAHPATIIFLSGSGTITRYFTTLQPAPGNMRTALVEASNGSVGNVIDKAFLACAQFNPDSNSYSASAFKIMKYATVLLTIVMGGILFWFWRREGKKLDEQAAQTPEDVLEAA
jgi:protein SCO1/2